jgi:uncharacterized protein YndB with AHSA1/START domain
MEHEVVTQVGAPPEKVWDVLTHVEAWPEWTDSMTEVELVDRPRLMSSARVRIVQPKMFPAVWTVTEFDEENHSFTWQSRAPGVTTTAVHRVAAGSGDGTSVVTLGVEQRGLLSGLIGRFLGGRIRSYVQMEADGLRRRVEA